MKIDPKRAENLKKFQENQAALASAVEKLSSKIEAFKKVKADCTIEVECDDDKDEVKEMVEDLGFSLRMLQYSMQYFNDELGYLWSSLSNHMNNGHLPAAPSAEQMARAVEALGLDSEYDVQKKVIWASTKKGLTATVDYKKP